MTSLLKYAAKRHESEVRARYPICSARHRCPASSVKGAKVDLVTVLIGASGLADWIDRHHHSGGDFSVAGVSAAREAGLNALRSGYSINEAFEAGRSAYFVALGQVELAR